MSVTLNKPSNPSGQTRRLPRTRRTANSNRSLYEIIRRDSISVMALIALVTITGWLFLRR